MRKLILSLTSVTLVCLISGIIKLHSQQQQRPWLNEVATPVQEDVLTPQQREHSKLYDSYGRQEKIRDTLLKHRGEIVSFTTACPFLPGRPVPDVIMELAEAADAIVTASFVSKSSQITASGTYLFTDYELRVEEVLKVAVTQPLKPETNITVTRPGGKVLLFGQTASFTNLAFKPLMPGRRYLLFLAYLPSTNAYRAVNHESSFDITDTRVETLSEAMVRPFERDRRDFVTSVKSAIAAAQKKGAAQ
jgi:hypothetical protein